MQTSKSNVVWSCLLSLIFLRPFIGQRCYPTLDIYYSLVFLFCALLWIIFRAKTSFKSQLNYPLLLFLIALFISTLFSINLRSSLKEAYKFAPYLAAFYLMLSISPEQKRKLLIVLVGAGSLLSLYAIYQFFWGFQNILDCLSQTEPYPYAEEFVARKRVFTTFFSPDMFAGYLIMMLPLAVGLFLDSLLKKNRFLWILTGLSISFMFISLLLTKSIGGWISLFIAFLVFSVLLFVHHPHLRRKIVWIAAVASIFIVAILAGILIIRADYSAEFASPQNSLIQRLYFWRSATKMIRDFPLAGVGPGNFGLIYPEYKSPQAIETHFAHNSYLQIWAEMGILGIAGWLWLILRSFQAGVRKLKVQERPDYLTVGLIAASSAFLTHNFIDFGFFIPEVAFHWWVISGLIAKETAALA